MDKIFSDDELRVIFSMSELAESGHSLVYTDAGNGSAGPGLMKPRELDDAVQEGFLDDLVIVDFDHQLLSSVLEQLDMELDREGVTQVEFNRLAGDNPYHIIAWVPRDE